MLKSTLRFCGCLLLLLACEAKPKPFTKGPHDWKDFIDVNSHLVYEARQVMQTPYFMYRITTKDGRRDSTVVSNEEFARWQTHFFTHNILAGDTGTWYRETSFGDTATNLVTTNYSCENPDLPVRNIDVMSSPESGFIKRIYIEKFYGNADSTVMEKLGWTAGKSMMINRSVERKNGQKTSEQTQIFWL